MATLKDALFAAIQDAPGLTAKEYAVLLDATTRMPSISSTLCSLRDDGYITSSPGDDSVLRFTAVKAREVGGRKTPAKKSNGQKAVIIQTNVVIEYDGMKYTLPQAVVDAIRRMK